MQTSELIAEARTKAMSMEYSQRWLVLEMARRLENLTSIDTVADVAEVRHGEWEDIIDTQSTIHRYQHTCGACGKSYFDHNKFNYPYCPNCGAKMDGKGEGE